MNRTLWLVVGIVLLVFLLSALLPLDGGGLRAEESTRLWKDQSAGRSLWDLVAPYIGADLGPVGWSVLGLGVVLLVILVVRARQRGLTREQRRALRLARRGRPVAEIARRMKLSQDAVRILLDTAARRRRGRGRFGRLFRPARISPLPGASGPGSDGGQPAGITAG